RARAGGGDRGRAEARTGPRGDPRSRERDAGVEAAGDGRRDRRGRGVPSNGRERGGGDADREVGGRVEDDVEDRVELDAVASDAGLAVLEVEHADALDLH